MKKNEAISILATSSRPREPKDRARYDEAVKMAIEALKQPETNCSEFPNSSDTISRQAVIRWVKQECNPYGKPTLDFESGKRVMEHLERMPSAQPERKTGRWIPDNTDYYRTKFICSVCGESEEVPTMGFGYAPMWGYCPNCGADMKGEQE